MTSRRGAHQPGDPPRVADRTDGFHVIRIVYEIVEEALADLADENVQRRLWLSTGGPDSPEIGSFSEFYCHLFDDSGLSVELDKQRMVYNIEIDRDLRALDALLKRVDDEQSVEAVLVDPYLVKARTAAQQLLQAIRSLRTRPEVRS